MDWILLIIVVTTSAPAGLKNHCRRARTEKTAGSSIYKKQVARWQLVLQKIADISMTKVVKSEEMEPGTEKE